MDRQCCSRRRCAHTRAPATATKPTRLVRAPFSVTRSDGVNSVTQSDRRLSFGTRLTLLVSVSCAENAGSRCQFCAPTTAAARGE